MFKKLTAFVMALCVIGGTALYAPEKPLNIITASAADYTRTKDGSLTFYVYADYAEVYKCNTSAEGEIIIPAEINGVPVTSIREHAFAKCTGVTSISIPDSVTSIGNDAFENTKLLEDNCKENQLVIIDNIIIDGQNYTESTLNIPENIRLIADCAFYKCTGLTSINIPDSVTSIGDRAFYDCENLSSIDIPNSVASIGDDAFSFCKSLTSINIPDSVTSIGEDAFWSCSGLTSIIVAENNENYCDIDGVLFNKDKTEILSYPIGKPDSEYIIPDSVTSIEKNAFEESDKLTSITLPDSVISIGMHAFWDCSELASINIPDSVTSIGDNAFSFCSELTSIDIPASVTSIGKCAFGLCSKLTSISVAENNENYCDIDGVLFNKDKTEILSYPEGKSDNEYIIPDGVTSIGEGAFWGCELASISIPDSVTGIGEDAFWSCSGLTSISIPDSVASIGDSAFSFCEELISINIPASVTGIGEDAFWNCTNLTDITILNPECKIYDYESTISNEDDSFNGTIHGYANSTAQAYAEKYGYKFAVIGDEAPAVYLAGDANGDGKTSISDAVRILQYVSNKEKYNLSGQALENADVYNKGDGITGMDAASIQRLDAGVIDSLPESVMEK